MKKHFDEKVIRTQTCLSKIILIQTDVGLCSGKKHQKLKKLIRNSKNLKTEDIVTKILLLLDTYENRTVIIDC